MSEKGAAGTAIGLRTARREDAPALRVLLLQLGYDVSEADVAGRIDDLCGRDADRVLVAVDGARVLGVIAVHWTAMLHAPGRVARITTLVVGEEARGRGIGRLLVEAGAAAARQAGCAVLELTTGLQRADARAFYEALGFIASSTRLHRSLA